MNNKAADLKSVLLFLVDEIERLRANQVVLSRFGNVQANLEIVQIAKDQALQETADHYDKLRELVRGLA